MYLNENTINNNINTNNYINETLNPMCIILIGISIKTASKSSKMTCSLALLNTHDMLRPAAFNMLNNRPAEVGAANLDIINTSFQIVNSSLCTGNVYLSYTAHSIHGKNAFNEDTN